MELKQQRTQGEPVIAVSRVQLRLWVTSREAASGTWSQHVVDEFQETLFCHVAICKQEDYWPVLNTQLLIQTFQIISEIIFSISSTQDDLKHLRMKTYTEKTQMDPRHDGNSEFQLDWIKGVGLAPVISKCLSIHKTVYLYRLAFSKLLCVQPPFLFFSFQGFLSKAPLTETFPLWNNTVSITTSSTGVLL